jgi:hypothetical protein
MLFQSQSQSVTIPSPALGVTMMKRKEKTDFDRLYISQTDFCDAS